MKKSVSLLILMSTLIAAHAHAAFMDDYAVKNWTKTTDHGSISASHSGDIVRLTSSNASDPKFFGERNQDFTIRAAHKGYISFDWSYSTKDKDGAFWDAFGWLLNGQFTKLSDDRGSSQQEGSFQAMVKVGDIFGFRANSLDSRFGSATTGISNFQAPAAVPVPAAIWLFSLPLIGLLRKGQKRSA